MLIGNMIEQAPVVELGATNKEVDVIFRNKMDIEGLVVLDGRKPAGIVTRLRFYQKIGTEFGFSLYMNRPVEMLMDKEPLLTDYSVSITQVSTIAMHRHVDKLYDFIVVTKHSHYFGVVSIKNLILKFAEVEIKRAKFMNPLTDLSGNHLIDQKLKDALQQDSYSIFYIDLDHFKAFNDTYGFYKGDQLIKKRHFH